MRKVFLFGIVFIMFILAVSCNDDKVFNEREPFQIITVLNAKQRSDFSQKIQNDDNFKYFINRVYKLHKTEGVKPKKQLDNTIFGLLNLAKNEVDISLLLDPYFTNSQRLAKQLMQINNNLNDLKTKNEFLTSKSISSNLKKEIFEKTIIDALATMRKNDLAKSKQMRTCDGVCQNQFGSLTIYVILRGIFQTYY